MDYSTEEYEEWTYDASDVPAQSKMSMVFGVALGVSCIIPVTSPISTPPNRMNIGGLIDADPFVNKYSVQVQRVLRIINEQVNLDIDLCMDIVRGLYRYRQSVISEVFIPGKLQDGVASIFGWSTFFTPQQTAEFTHDLDVVRAAMLATRRYTLKLNKEGNASG